MTVEVDTPVGLRSGSSVMEIQCGKEPVKFAEGAALATDLRGEAVAVNLPNGILFSLLGQVRSGQGLAVGVTESFVGPIKADGKDFYDKVNELGGRQNQARPPAIVRPDNYPMLVRFRDIRDPKSVETVDPDDLAASFGPGVKLKRITVQITDEPVTKGIEKRLGWLNHLDEYRTDPNNPFTNTLPREVSGLRSPMTR